MTLTGCSAVLTVDGVMIKSKLCFSQVKVKVVTKVKLEGIEVSVVDKEHGIKAKTTRYFTLTLRTL